MLRILVHALAVLHLGPGIAFALLAFGCEGAPPPLGDACTAGPMRFFMVATVLSWLVLGGVSALLLRRSGARPHPLT